MLRTLSHPDNLAPTLRYLWRIAASLIIASFMSACKTTSEPKKVLSAEEAKRVAVELSDQDLGAPPRSLAALEPLPHSFAEVADPPSCVKPAEKVTLQGLIIRERELEAAGKSKPKNYNYRDRALREMRLGQLSNAVAYQQAARRATTASTSSSKEDLYLATIYAEAGNFEKAESLLSEAGPKLAASADQSKDQSCKLLHSFMVKRAEGLIHLAQGNMKGAETDLIEAREYLNHVLGVSGGGCDWSSMLTGGVRRKADIGLKLGETVLWQGRTTEAETVVREALRTTRTARPPALVLLSDIYFEQGRFEDSLRVSLGAITSLDAACAPSDALQRGRAYEAAGRAFIGLRRWDEAAETFAALQQLMQTDAEAWDRRFKVNRDRGLALLRSGKVQQAREVLEAVANEQSRRLGADNYQTIETRAFLAMTIATAGEHTEALRQMRETVPKMLDRWRESAGDSVSQVGRTFRLRLVAESYLRLLLDTYMGGDPRDEAALAEAFQIAEGVSTRAVQRALAESTARSLAKDPLTEQLVRQRQDLEKQLMALRFRLQDAYGTREASTPEVLGALRGQIEQAEAALRGLEQEVAKVFPEYAALTNPKPVSLAEARESLEPGEALVLTFAGEDRLFVWAVPKEGKPLAHVALLGSADLKQRVDVLHEALSPNVQTLGDIPAYDVAGGYDLYQQLLEPVSPAWKDEKRLLVVADGPLGLLPFAVLPTANVPLAADDAPLFEGYRQVPWLVRTHGLAQLPSVASLINLRRARVGLEDRYAFIGFGDPWFDRNAEQVAAVETRGVMRGVAPASQPIQLRSLPQTRAADSATLASLPRLPDTADEIRAVAETLGANLDRDVYLGLEASERHVKDLNESGELKKYRTLSFATHGLVPGDLDGLTKPALAMAAPTLEEAELGDDGLLTSDEILGLRLDADWAVLSACNTAAAEGAGAEAVSGLGRAFFYAGVKAILVSNWPVHSDATRLLMTHLFTAYAVNGNQGRSESLQTAMQYLIDEGGFEADGELIFSYAHPIFWAPFMIVGDGG